MSYKNNKRASAPDKFNKTFSVDDGVHWGFNGDRYPGTILFVSDSGREVAVSPDTYIIIDNLGGYVEGNRCCEFITIKLPVELCDKWKLYKDGFWRKSPSKSTAWTLKPGRYYSQNPSF